MILTCPECGTQYVVKDGAIPAGGRQVRCASCKHSWHQDPPEPEALELNQEIAEPESIEEPAVEAEAPMPVDVVEDAPAGEDPPSYEPVVPPPSPEPAFQPPIADERWQEESPAPDDEFAPFGPRDYAEEPKRGVLRTLVLLVLLVAAIAAAFWFLAPPEWKARIGLAQSDQTPLQLMLTHNDRQALASGNELLAVTGRVINPTAKTQSVPPIHAQLRSNSGQIVYSWTISPPARSLEPGASATFNSAEVNVPAGGDQLTITLGPPRA